MPAPRSFRVFGAHPRLSAPPSSAASARRTATPHTPHVRRQSGRHVEKKPMSTHHGIPIVAAARRPGHRRQAQWCGRRRPLNAAPDLLGQRNACGNDRIPSKSAFLRRQTRALRRVPFSGPRQTVPPRQTAGLRQTADRGQAAAVRITKPPSLPDAPGTARRQKSRSSLPSL